MTPGISRSVVGAVTRIPVDALGTTLWTPLVGVDQPRSVRGCDLRWSTGPRGRSRKVDHPTRNAVTSGNAQVTYPERHGGLKVVHRFCRFAGPPHAQPLKNQGQSGPVQVVPPTGVGPSGPDRPREARRRRTTDTTNRHRHCARIVVVLVRQAMRQLATARAEPVAP